MKRIKPSFLPGICWLILSIFLLTIPGTAFPQENWLNKIWFDKWVHIGMFALMVLLWCWATLRLDMKPQKRKTVFICMAILWLLYGITMEFVQKYCVVNRSFDRGDIIADGVGCLIGLVYCLARYKKKLTPVETGVATKTNCL